MTAQLSETVFGAEFNEALVHQVVCAYQAKARSGNSAQKTRSDVRGGGAKPWKQKGTGRARAGTSRSPLWRSGGVTFASRKRDYSQKVNKKMYRAAMRSILSELKRQGRLQIIDSITFDVPKTAKFLEILRQYDIKRGLIVDASIERNLDLASRNIKDIAVVEASGIDPVSLIWADKVLITAEAAKQFEELYA